MRTGATKAKVLAEYERLKPGLDGPAADGTLPPPVDSVHKTKQLWKTGERIWVDGWLEARGSWRHEPFARVVQAPFEPAGAGSEERSIPESVQNHLRARSGPLAPQSQLPLQGFPRGADCDTVTPCPAGA